LGIETVGVDSVGTETVGVETDGTETVGVDTDGTDRLGTVSAGLECGGMPTRRTANEAMSNASAALAPSRAQRLNRFWGPRWPLQPPRMAKQTYPTLLISMHAYMHGRNMLIMAWRVGPIKEDPTVAGN
jgi:hypothetical protein